MESSLANPDDEDPPFDEEAFESLVGRPTAFDQATANRVIEGVERGLTFANAAALAGISYSTLNRWRKRGQSPTCGNEEFREFWKRLERAKGEAALRLLNCINSAAESGDWKAATWILERRYSNEWGRNGAGFDPLEPLLPF
jgi:hypothetical protein